MKTSSRLFVGLVGNCESKHLDGEIGLSWTLGDGQAQIGCRKKFYYRQEEDSTFSTKGTGIAPVGR